ncbi:diacylglycerol kinase family protein [Herbivorax sp. ANBcel31]|uniref:diacylglycerol/lipid kinase family protein n=1 Tax=Herbivorax sp. ANBcel31 TaxID=3069754 RepID=UPI0027B1EC02|nr:diacylglycerol kinase family protein [Herbivorax sp. ANBcel31]MDQ2087526.1 diacylglycerol kinase family protein [Herbivorax sp. ANBcel31]
MRCFFILNPGSKGGTSKKTFKKIFDLLDKSSINYHYKITNSLEDAFSFSKEANNKGYDVIVAVGGDGTINKVLSGFYNENGSRISKAKMGVIYTGTSPDFCKSYNIPIKLKKAVEVILDNKSKKIQIGKIVLAKKFMMEYEGQLVDYTSNFKTCYFACCANIGLGAQLARRANTGIRSFLGDYIGTFTALIKTFFSYKPCQFQMIADGKNEKIERVHNISIGRTFYIASGIKVKNKISQGDGLFYRLTVKNMRLKDFFLLIKKVYSGKEMVDNRFLTLDYIKKIEICGNKTNPEVEFDGDPAGFLPCTIEIADQQLDIVCEVDCNG